MFITKEDLKALITLAGNAKNPIHFVGSAGNTGSIRYYLKDVPQGNKSFLYFMKAVPFVPDFNRWPMSFDRDRLGGHEFSKSMCDVSTYAPDKNNIFKDLILNLQKDFVLRTTPFPLNQMNLLSPQTPSMSRPYVGSELAGIQGGIPVPFGSGIAFDDFLDGKLVDNLQYMPDNHPARGFIYPEKALGYVIFDDPSITKPINEAKVFYYNPFGFTGKLIERVPKGKELVDIVMFFGGINPRMNPKIRKISAFELARLMEKEGYKVRQEAGKLVVYFTQNDLVSGIFDKWTKKLTKWVKNVGKKIEKEVTTPVRNMLKDKAPGVWKVIDNIDKKVGVTQMLRKYGTQIEVFAKKYGGEIIESAIMSLGAAAASEMGVNPEDAKQYLSTAIKVTNVVSDPKKSNLLDLAQKAFSKTVINRGGVSDIVGDLLGNIEGEMESKKGIEGKKDFNSLLNMMQDAFTGAKKEAEEMLKGDEIAALIEPVTQKGNIVKTTLDAIAALVN